MNWDAIGAIGEVFGAFAVVASVIYLAVQIKKQTTESQLAATRELQSQMQTQMDKISDSSEFAEIWLKGVQNYETLPNVERVRLSMFFNRAMRILEQQYLHTARGTIDPVYFESAVAMYSEFLRFPGVQQWWPGSREQFEPQFREEAERLLKRAIEQGYESSFKNPPPNKSVESDT